MSVQTSNFSSKHVNFLGIDHNAPIKTGTTLTFTAEHPKFLTFLLLIRHISLLLQLLNLLCSYMPGLQHLTSGQVRSGQIRSDQVRSGQVRSGQVTPVALRPLDTGLSSSISLRPPLLTYTYIYRSIHTYPYIFYPVPLGSKLSLYVRKSLQ